MPDLIELTARLETELHRLNASPAMWDDPDTAVRVMAEQLARTAIACLTVVDFPSQDCPACLGEHVGQPCPQEVLPL